MIGLGITVKLYSVYNIFEKKHCILQTMESEELTHEIDILDKIYLFLTIEIILKRNVALKKTCNIQRS